MSQETEVGHPTDTASSSPHSGFEKAQTYKAPESLVTTGEMADVRFLLTTRMTGELRIRYAPQDTVAGDQNTRS